MSRSTFSQVQNSVSHLNPGHASPPFMSWELHLSSILIIFQPFEVSGYTAQLNPSPISPPSMSWYLRLTSILAPKFTSPLHSDNFNPGPYICLWTTTRLCLTSIPSHQGYVSPPYRYPYQGLNYIQVVSPQSRSWYLHLTSIQVKSH